MKHLNSLLSRWITTFTKIRIHKEMPNISTEYCISSTNSTQQTHETTGEIFLNPTLLTSFDSTQEYLWSRDFQLSLKNWFLKMFSIFHHQGNVNQNVLRFYLTPERNGYHQDIELQEILVRIIERSHYWKGGNLV